MLRQFVAIGLMTLGVGHVWVADGADWKALCNDGKAVRFRNRRVMELS
jgi:hypothetical protein